MPRKTGSSKKPKLVKNQPTSEDLESFIREASEVKQLTQMAGWAILERDLANYRNGLINKLVYLHPSKPDFYEARLLFIAIDKLFSIVNDYESNRDKAIELLDKIQNQDISITMDIDTE